VGVSWGHGSWLLGCQALDLFISQLSFQDEDTGQNGSKCGKHTDHSHWNFGVNLKMGTHQSRAIWAILLSESLRHRGSAGPSEILAGFAPAVSLIVLHVG